MIIAAKPLRIKSCVLVRALASVKAQLPTPNLPEVDDRTGDVDSSLSGAFNPVSTEV